MGKAYTTIHDWSGKPSSRTFDGSLYVLGSMTPRKSEAKTFANNYRKSGLAVRQTCTAGGWYLIWIQKKEWLKKKKKRG